MASIQDIFKKFLNNECTKEEKDILLQYFDLPEYEDITVEIVDKELERQQDEKLPPEYEAMIDRNHQKLLAMVNKPSRKNNFRIWVTVVGVAASVVVAFSLIYRHVTNNDILTPVSKQNSGEVEPGANRATLVLENGRTFNLREDAVGIRIEQNKLTYTDGTKISSTDHVQFATLVTPRKGQYRAVLPDGTKVWLNAESSLRYPTSFVTNEREVELTGEGYFEVTPDAKRPFIVKTAKQQLKVLGTEFNLNAYTNESTTVTTLIEGSVQLMSKGSAFRQMLKPNQQASLQESKYTINKVDVEPYSAWKDGEFRFKATPLPEVIKQLQRWYDLDVDYNGIPSHIKINASINRRKKLSSVLAVLSDISNMQIKIQGRRLMVSE